MLRILKHCHAARPTTSRASSSWSLTPRAASGAAFYGCNAAIFGCEYNSKLYIHVCGASTIVVMQSVHHVVYRGPWVMAARHAASLQFVASEAVSVAASVGARVLYSSATDCCAAGARRGRSAALTAHYLLLCSGSGC
jgi:hypothetical protein